MARYITTFRNETNPLQWDFHVSEGLRELEQVASNLKRRGVKTYTTHELGPQIVEFTRYTGETNDAN